MGPFGASNRSVAQATTQCGGGHTGPSRRLENKGMVLPPSLETKTSLEEQVYCLRNDICMASKEVSEMTRHRLGVRGCGAPE